MTPDQRELWLERAAIYEYEAGMSREEADRRAMQDLFHWREIGPPPTAVERDFKEGA